LVEAWSQGFDRRGCQQLGGERLLGSNTWIGPTDCAALLRSFGVAACIVDVHIGQMLRNENALFEWLERWFSGGDCAPVLLQWSGMLLLLYVLFDVLLIVVGIRSFGELCWI
jgi:hypothetical protein